MLVIVLHRPTVAGLFPHHDIAASARPQTGWAGKTISRPGAPLPRSVARRNEMPKNSGSSVLGPLLHSRYGKGKALGSSQSQERRTGGVL
jgi:hypothetical protein